jgi:transposase
MISLIDEKKLSLTELAKREGVHVSTVWRWVLRGVRGARLESFCAGGRRFTTEPAWIRFCEATTAASTVAFPAPAWRTNRAAETAMTRAEHELFDAGA